MMAQKTKALAEMKAENAIFKTSQDAKRFGMLKRWLDATKNKFFDEGFKHF